MDTSRPLRRVGSWRRAGLLGAVLLLPGSLIGVASAETVADEATSLVADGTLDTSESLIAPEVAPMCHGKRATIWGTSGNDLLKGTSGDDVIVGLGGNDRIYGKGGNDTLCGNTGADKLFPGKGDDFVSGGGGSKDWVKYSTVRRRVVVSLRTGVATGQGRDTLVGIENVLGSPRGDKLTGNGLNNRILGGPGSDKVFGKKGNDVLQGGSGFDVADGGLGTDTCTQDAELRFNCERGHKSITSGTWTVPGEVKPLIYRNSTSQNGCYWARLSGFGGGLEDIIANQFHYEIDIVEVAKSDVGFETSRCGTWTTNLTPRTLSPTSAFAGGAYLIGWEVGPGVWRNSDSSDGCYWERRSGFGGTLDDVITNSFSYDVQTVSIAKSDRAFYSSGCGTWKRIG